MREAFHEAVLPAFAGSWKEQDRADVRFEESYSGFGAQSRAIASGFDADIAVLSLEGDIERLVKAGLVTEDWNAGPDKGMITRSLVVIGVRDGNPQGIKDWADLARPERRRALPRPEDLRRRPLEHQRHLRRGAAAANVASGGKPDPDAAPRPAGAGPGQRRQHGLLGPAEHGHLRARHRRRRRHLRERAAPAAAR